MRSRLLSLAALVVLIGTVIGVVALVPSQTTAPSQRPGPGSPAPTDVALPPPPPGTTYRDHVYATTTVATVPAVRTQSRLWFAHDTWWAGMLQPATNQLDIFRLDAATQRWIDTGTLVDERPFANADFLWTEDHLYVVTAGPRPTLGNQARVLRYSFDEPTERFVLDPNFPVAIVGTGVGSAVITRDGTGALWVAFTADSKIWVVHTLDHDANWAAPYVLPVTNASVGPEDIASILAFGPGRIGVIWSSQPRNSVFFSTHEDGDPDDAWTAPEIVLDGIGSSDDRLDPKAYALADGSGTGVAVVVRTSLDVRVPRNGLDPQVLLALRDADGAWATALVGQVRDHHSRAMLMVDDTARMFYVAMTAPAAGGALYYKRSSIDAPTFETGVGVPLLTSEADLRIHNGATTKAALTTGSGLIVLGTDADSGRYLHAVVDLGGGPPTADPGDPARLVAPPLPDPPGRTTYLHDDFEPWTVGPATGTGWLLRPEDPPDAVALVDDGAGGRALRVRTPAGRVAARACHAFAEVAGAPLTIEARVRTSVLGTSDTTLLSVRGNGGEAASIRATDRGVFAWFSRATKVRSTRKVTPGTWYRISLTIDQVAHTYDLRLAFDDDRPIIARSDVPWRTPELDAVGSICLETAGASRAQAIDLAEVQVLQGTRP
ncbi:MAG: hypothetical protein ACXW4T_00810 [Candidatus Limnocylindrales bacterium]